MIIATLQIRLLLIAKSKFQQQAHLTLLHIHVIFFVVHSLTYNIDELADRHETAETISQ